MATEIMVTKPTTLELMTAFFAHAINLLNMKDLPDRAKGEADLMLLMVLQWLGHQIKEDRDVDPLTWAPRDRNRFLNLYNGTESTRLSSALESVCKHRRVLLNHALSQMPDDIELFFRRAIGTLQDLSVLPPSNRLACGLTEDEAENGIRVQNVVIFWTV